MGYAKQVIGDSAVLMGNIDPSYPLVWGSPEQVDLKAKEIVEKTGGVGLFLSSGCAMGYNTPEEHMTALVNAARKYGTYDRLRKL